MRENVSRETLLKGHGRLAMFHVKHCCSFTK
jgi:hypothetical protein